MNIDRYPKNISKHLKNFKKHLTSNDAINEFKNARKLLNDRSNAEK